MWEVSDADFKEITSWGLTENPFKAVSDYSDLKKELRWLNQEHREAWEAYIYARMDYIGDKDFDDYYKNAEKPIDQRRWNYLMNRKAWYIMPLGWDIISSNSCRVVDIGCGDGDTVQRLINFINESWKLKNIENLKIEIVGTDLNFSRIENAKKLVKTINSNIVFEFIQADIISNGLDYENGYFDYAICTGVLEILNDQQCNSFINEMCRLTSKGIYIEDLYEKFPGGYPRDLEVLFKPHKFYEEKIEIVFSEPFSVDKLNDPKKLWPIVVDQNVWMQKH